MHRADEIKEYPEACINGKWVKARPIMPSLKRRIIDAIQVLKGKADAVRFYRQ
jgi:hypothetical protein